MSNYSTIYIKIQYHPLSKLEQILFFHAESRRATKLRKKLFSLHKNPKIDHPSVKRTSLSNEKRKEKSKLILAIRTNKPRKGTKIYREKKIYNFVHN